MFCHHCLRKLLVRIELSGCDFVCQNIYELLAVSSPHIVIAGKVETVT